MFKWWHEPILPKSTVKWSYVVGFSVLWLTTKYYLQRTFNPAVASLDTLAILMGCIVLATIQSMLVKDRPEAPAKSKQEQAAEQKKKQHKQKSKRHP